MTRKKIEALLGQKISSISWAELGGLVFKNEAGEVLLTTDADCDIYDEHGMRFDTGGLD